MEPMIVVAFLSATLGPVAGIVTGLILDRRNKHTTTVNSKGAAREAATHEFEAITAGYTEYVKILEKRAGTVAEMERRLEDVEAKLEVALRNLRRVTAHLDVVEALVPVHLLPPRPQFDDVDGAT